MPNRVPIVVISGFLGSGKTTFLRYLLQQSKSKIGLLINEFGDVGIDGDLIKSCRDCNDNSPESIIELNNGCLCCTVQDDFIPAIQSLLKSKSNLEMIIIETSGLSLPIPLLKALSWPEIRASVYLNFVIGIVNGESMLKGSPINNLYDFNNQYIKTKNIEHNSSLEELFEEQLEVSDIVLISRADVLSDQEFNLIKQKIKERVNPNIPILKSFNGETNLEFIFDQKLIKDNISKFVHEEHYHSHAEIFSKYIKCDYFLEKINFEKTMSQILKDINILRIKGRVWIPGKENPLQVQIVGRKINTWFEGAPNDLNISKNKCGTELVLIGFQKEHFQTFEKKIKEKFNILNDPKIGI